MASATVEKTAEELRKEIAELQRGSDSSGRSPSDSEIPVASTAPARLRAHRAVVMPAAELEDQPALKRRLSSAVVKLEGEEEKEDANGSKDINEKSVTETGAATTVDNNKPRPNPLGNSGFRRDGNPRMGKMDYDVLPTEPVPRVLLKDEDPSLVKRNRRMLGQLLGTLEVFWNG